MSPRRRTAAFLVAGFGSLLGGLLVHQHWQRATPPPTAARAAATPDGVAETGAKAKPAPRRMPLGTLVTIDDDADLPERKHRIRYVEDLFRAEGLEVGDDAAIRFHSTQNPGRSFTARIAEMALYVGHTRVTNLPLNTKPARRLANEERRASLTFQGLVQGMDLQFDYDGRQIKEYLRLEPAFVETLQAAKADELRITYRFDRVTAGPGEQPLAFRASPDDEPLGTTNLDPKQTLFLSRPRARDFELPPAWVDGGLSGKTYLRRRLDLTEAAQPKVTVVLPLSYLIGAGGAVTIDPTVLDSNTSLSTEGTSRAMVRGRDGTLYVVYVKYLADPNGGRSRHSIVWASGRGNDWSLHGHVSPVRVAPADQMGDQYRPTACIQSDGTIHVLWDERYLGTWTGEGEDVYQVVHAYKPPGSEEFISTGFVNKNLAGDQYYATCAVDGRDNVFVSFWSRTSVEPNQIDRYFGMWDPGAVSLVPLPPPPVGGGGTRSVAGSIHHIRSFAYNNSETSITVGGDGRVYVRDARYYSGGPVRVGTMTNWLPGLGPGDIDWEWTSTPNINNSSPEGHENYTLLGPHQNQTGARNQWYRTGDSGLPPENTASRWRYTNPADPRECFNAYNYYGNISAVPVGPNVDDIHYVTRIGIHTYTREDLFPEDPFSTCWPGREAAGYHRFYRTYYARYDASLARWVDHTLVFGPNDEQSNLYREQFPHSALATDGSLHVVASRESPPSHILYRRRAPNAGEWDDWRSLVPGGALKAYPNIRGSNYPLGGPLVEGGPPTDRNHPCAMRCTVACAEAEQCGNGVDPETLDVHFTIDGGRVVYLPMGEPVE